MFKVPIANGSTLTYQAIMKNAIQTKYSMIRYYYTQLSLMSQNEAGPFYKPMYFEFPNDKNAYLETERNVMLGDSLKLSVVSNALNTTWANYYFPTGTWCDLFKDNMADKSCIVSPAEGST
jgi:alpha-glucosidase (family GH31 glycosyl hydrolase)